MQGVNDKIFITKWFSSLITVWYISAGLYWYYPKTLEMLYWPLHTHDIEIKSIKSTVNWDAIHRNMDVMDKLDLYRIRLDDLK